MIGSTLCAIDPPSEPPSEPELADDVSYASARGVLLAAVVEARHASGATPCEHNWVDISAHGGARVELCVTCQERRDINEGERVWRDAIARSIETGNITVAEARAAWEFLTHPTFRKVVPIGRRKIRTEELGE